MFHPGRSVVTLCLLSVWLAEAAPISIHNRHKRAALVKSPLMDDDSMTATIVFVLSSSLVILFILSGVLIFFCAKGKRKGSKDGSGTSGANTSLQGSAIGVARSASCEGGTANPTPSATTTPSAPNVKKEEGKMEHGVVDEKNFKCLGPLIVDSGVKGKVRHATEGEKSESIKEVVFDENQNLVRFIGSDIEYQQTSRQQTVEVDEGDNTLVPSQMSRSTEYTNTNRGKNVAILRVERTQDCQSVKPRTGQTKSRKSLNRKGMSKNGKQSTNGKNGVNNKQSQNKKK